MHNSKGKQHIFQHINFRGIWSSTFNRIMKIESKSLVPIYFKADMTILWHCPPPYVTIFFCNSFQSSSDACWWWSRFGWCWMFGNVRVEDWVTALWAFMWIGNQYQTLWSSWKTKTSQLLLDVWSCVVWDERNKHLSNCILCTCMAFLQCERGCASSEFLLGWMSSRTLNSDVASLHCGWEDVG